MQNIEVTDDGSHTIRHPDLGVTYHSTHGAITESRHVFVRNGLEYIFTEGKNPISVLEIGFGTGLNAFLTFLYTKKHPSLAVRYTGIEKFPPGGDCIRQLNYPEKLNAEGDADVFYKMHSGAPFESANFRFELMLCDVLEPFELSRKYDVIYFDAFAPNAQSEMWDTRVLATVANAMRIDGIFVTYCAQGQFKRNLRALALEVESLPGPPGKREMVRARKV